MPQFMVMHAFDPKPLSSAVVRGRILRTMQEVVKGIRKDYEAITATWNHNVPIDPLIAYRGGNAQIIVRVHDRIFNYLDKGTHVRYATMEPGFMPKTYVGMIGSVPGSGGKWFVTRKRPHKGIHARHWTLLLQIKHGDILADSIDDVLKRPF